MLEDPRTRYKPEPPKNPEGERAKHVADVYKRIENSRWIRMKLLHELNAENFNKEEFEKLINNWNNKINNFEEAELLETIPTKQGKLNVFYSKGLKSIKFEFYPLI